MKAITLGKKNNADYYVQIPSDPQNFHVLELGASGSGKTFAMRKIETAIASAGGAVLIMNFGDTHTDLQAQPNVCKLNVSTDGIPFPLLTTFVRPDNSLEDIDDVVEAVANCFSLTNRLYVKQKTALKKQLAEVLQFCRGQEAWEMLAHNLRNSDDEVDQYLWEKFRPVFTKLKFTQCKGAELQLGKICIIDLADFDFSTQCVATEFILSSIWRYYRLWGQRADEPLFIACDEFQNLNLKADSVLAEILREGRKFNIALLLATQTLETFDKGKIALVQQAATQLYFRPVPNEARKMARMTGTDDISRMEKTLLDLKQGECIAAGRLQIGNLKLERPVKIKF